MTTETQIKKARELLNTFQKLMFEEKLTDVDEVDFAIKEIINTLSPYEPKPGDLFKSLHGALFVCHIKGKYSQITNENGCYVRELEDMDARLLEDIPADWAPYSLVSR